MALLKGAFSLKPLSCQAEVANEPRESPCWHANGEHRNHSPCLGQVLLRLYWPQVIVCDLWMQMGETWLDEENNQKGDVLIELEGTSRGGCVVFCLVFRCFPFDNHTGVI